MTKEMEFFIYLIENYASYKGINTGELINKLDKLNLTNKIFNMYEIYHQESLENAFDDINKMLEEKNN